MKIIDELRFHELVARGEIMHRDCEFLDGLKIGLRIKPSGKMLPPVVNFASPGAEQHAIDFQTTQIQANTLYLAETVEQLSISSRIFGLLHTRSRVARLGLEAVCGSNYVAPGFGNGESTSLVLEIKSTRTLVGLPLALPIAGLLLFELDRAVRVGAQMPGRFPF